VISASCGLTMTLSVFQVPASLMESNSPSILFKKLDELRGRRVRERGRGRDLPSRENITRQEKDVERCRELSELLPDRRMESLFEKLRAARSNLDALRSSIQSNGTPVRTGTKMAREAIESSYGEFVSSVNQVEQTVDSLTSSIDQFREKNAAITNYCQVHPSTAIFGSAGAVAVPSYFSTFSSSSFLANYFPLLVVFGARGMMLGALGTASVATLFVGALFFSQRKHKGHGEKE
jgi:hypothetical protein